LQGKKSILQIFSLFLSILLRMDKNSPFSERLNDMQGFALHPPEALPLDSGREHSPLHPEFCVVFMVIRYIDSLAWDR
jgi:hypothetical protein